MHEAEPPVEDPGTIDLRGVAWGGAWIVAGIVLACAAAYLAFSLLRPAAGYGGPNGAAPMPVEGPRLEPAPQSARAAYEAEKARLINGYGWVDRRAGIARIPVEQAMRLTAERASGEKAAQ